MVIVVLPLQLPHVCMHHKIDAFKELVLATICILTGTVASQAQNTTSGVTLHPVDTGRNVVTFDLSATRHNAVPAVRYAIKTNLLYAIGFQSPNVAFEYFVGGHSSVEAAVGYNNWGNLWDFSKKGPDYDPANYYKRRFDHIFVRADYHYWLRDLFDGHYLGAGLFYSKYNTGEVNIPTVFEKGFDYYGHVFGGGISYGYLWSFSKRWAAEFSLGVGVAFMSYDKSMIRDKVITGSETEPGGYELVNPVSYQKIYLGPTSVGIKLVFMIE
jgi:hypothetical protein